MTSTRSAALALALAWGIAPAAYALETDADCNAFAQGALALQTMYTADPFEAHYDPSEETCVIEDLTLVSTRGWEMDLYIEEVLYESDKTGLERVQNGLPPQELGITLWGARPFLSARLLESPALNYTMRVQAMSHPGSAFYLGYNWSPEEKRFRDFEIYYGMATGYSGNELQITADIRDVDLTDWATIEQSLGSARAYNLDIQLWFNGMFEGLVAPYLGRWLLHDNSPPEAQVEALKRIGVAFANDLPKDIFETDSRAGLAELIQTLPHPRGRLSTELISQEGIGMGPFIAGFMAGKPPSLEGLWEILETSGSKAVIYWEPLDE